MTHFNTHTPVPTPSIIRTVTRFDQTTSSQLRRLHYQGSDRGKEVRSRRHLARLVKLGKLRRMWGIYDGGEKEYVYFSPGTTAKPDDHTLDIVELYVRLYEALGLEEEKYEPEEWGYKKIGQMTLTPDAYLDLGGKRKFFIEVDRGTERPARLRAKMRHYVNAHEQSRKDQGGGIFPLVIWVTHDRKGMSDIKNAIRRQTEPRLFTVMLFDEVVERLAKGQ